MKLFIVALTTIFFLQAGSIEDFAHEHAYETNYEKAIMKAKKENKTVMMILVTHYCPWCRKYEKNTLSKKSVSAIIAQKYVPLILNREKHQFPDKFDTPRIPTTFFIEPHEERLIYSEMGFKTKSQFMEMINRVKD